MKVLYIPTGRLTFDVDAAKNKFNMSMHMLNSIEDVTLIAPKEFISSPECMMEFIQKNNTNVDCVLFQHITFTDGEFIAGVAESISAPIILWGVNEPDIGGRLRLNSLTGVMSSANYLGNHNRNFLFIMGDPGDKVLEKDIKSKFQVVNVINKTAELKIGVVGNHPDGFYFSATNKAELNSTFGTSICEYSLQEVFDSMSGILKKEYLPELEYAQNRIAGLDTEDIRTINFAKATAAIKKLIKKDNLNALAMRCWPDYFEQLDIAPCGVFSQLTEQGYPVGCEADIHGSLSMYILKELSCGNPPFMGDIVNIISEDNSIVLWHCGFAPYSMANPNYGIVRAGVHPNRKIGFALDFGGKEGKVTLFRVSWTPEGYRFLVASGYALNVPNCYKGTSVKIKMDSSAENFVHRGISESFEPHFAMVYGDVTKEIEAMGKLLGIKTIAFKEE